MKNFLIPTTLEIDTISAVKSAINQAKNTNCEIILMMVSDTPDAFSSAQFLREMRTALTTSQEEVLETCRYIIEHTANCKLKVHNQYGLSTSIFKGIIDALGTELNKDDFNKALYIENASANMHVKDVQQFLSANFSFEIVSQTANFDNNYEQFAPYLSEAISKYDIDLLVETRKGEKIKFKKRKKENENDRMGLPVLSLYEMA
jgi:hypothetical protein